MRHKQQLKSESLNISRDESSVRTSWDADVEAACDGWCYYVLMTGHNAPNLSPQVRGLCTRDKQQIKD